MSGIVVRPGKRILRKAIPASLTGTAWALTYTRSAEDIAIIEHVELLLAYGYRPTLVAETTGASLNMIEAFRARMPEKHAFGRVPENPGSNLFKEAARHLLASWAFVRYQRARRFERVKRGRITGTALARVTAQLEGVAGKGANKLLPGDSMVLVARGYEEDTLFAETCRTCRLLYLRSREPVFILHNWGQGTCPHCRIVASIASNRIPQIRVDQAAVRRFYKRADKAPAREGVAIKGDPEG